MRQRKEQKAFKNYEILIFKIKKDYEKIQRLEEKRLSKTK